MIPVLFKEDEQIFTHNGIGALYESLSCDVIEEENGEFTMELEYPVDGELFSEIKDFRIIQAKPNDIDDPHNFRIYEIEKSIDELTVFVRANTITNDLGNNLITNYVGGDVTPQEAMNGIKSNLIESTNFDLISDIQTRSNVEWTRINPLNAIVGVRGSLVDIWGGQIKRTNRAIHLYSRRGRDNVVTIRPGKNIEGLNMTVSTAGLVTKILPTFTYSPVDVPEYQMVTLSDGTKEKRRVSASGSTTLRDDITVLGDVVSSQYVNNYPTNYWSSVDYGDDDELRNKVDKYIDDRLSHAEESPGIVNMGGFDGDLKDFVKTELNKRAAQYFTHRNPGVDKPTIRIKVNMLQLSDSPDWEEFKNLERIGLTDTLDVWVEEYDIDVEVRVTTLTYDSIGEEVTNFNAGSDRPPRQSSMEKKYDDLTKSTNDYVTSFKNGVKNIMRNTADGLNRKFEGYTEPPAHLSSEGDIWFREIGEGKVEIWIHDGVYWQPVMTEDFGDKLLADIEAVEAELEEAKQQAILDTEQALSEAKAHADAEVSRIDTELTTEIDGAIDLAEQAKQDAINRANQALEDANAHAEAEDARIRGELSTEIDGAIELAEQAKADAVTKANQALADAKAYAEAEDTRIKQEIGLEVDDAIDLAEKAKQEAIDRANQALEDAKAHADAGIQANKEHFDNLIEDVETDVTNAQATADSAVEQIDTAVSNAGFTSLDETISNVDGRVATNTLNLDGAIIRMGTAEGKITQIETNVNGLQTTVASKASQSQVTQLATLVDTKVTSSQVNSLIKTDKTILDTRSVDSPPSHYISNYSRETVREFKNLSTMGISNEGSYGILESIIPWTGTSGGGIKQTLTTDHGVWERSGTTSWTTWKKTADQTWVGAQVSVLENNINLRVAKGDVLSQINIEAEQTLIQSNKLVLDSASVVFTGSAFIPSAQIQSVHADKITAGTIKSARINSTEIVTQGLTTNVVKSTHIETSTATIDKLFANQAMINQLTTKTAFINNIKAVEIDAGKITSGTINAARLNASAIVTAGLTSNVVKSTHIETSTATVDKIFATNAMINRLTTKTAFISSVQAVDISAARITSGTINAARLNASAIVTAGLTTNVVKSTHIETSTATIDKLFANETMINRLTAKTAFINSIKAVNIDAARITTGTINAARLNASAIVTAGLTANVVKSTHIHGDTALFDKLFSTTSATDRLSARSAWIKNANIADASIDGAKIVDATIGNAKIASLDVSKISGNRSEFVQSYWNSTSSSVKISAEEGLVTTLSGAATNNGSIKLNSLGMTLRDNSDNILLTLHRFQSATDFAISYGSSSLSSNKLTFSRVDTSSVGNPRNIMFELDPRTNTAMFGSATTIDIRGDITASNTGGLFPTMRPRTRTLDGETFFGLGTPDNQYGIYMGPSGIITYYNGARRKLT